MADVFWSYWDASVRFGLLALALILLAPLLRRWITPKILCWAWAILMIRLFLPLALPFSGSIFNLSEKLQPSTWANALRSGIVDAGLGETILPVFRDQDALVISKYIGFSWENLLLLVWIAGIVGLLIGLVVNIIRLNRFFTRAEKHTSGRLYEVFRKTRRHYGIHANVPLLVSDDVKTPGIAGIFNPRVVIPRICAKELSDSDLRCVLLHELAHYRRGDLFLHHLLLLVCFIHWFNPLVWLVLRNFKISMEQACDSDVVESECAETQQYGFTLLQVMRRSRARYGSPAGALCLLGNRKNGAMKDRIRLIARPRRWNPVFGLLGLGIFGASFVFALTGEQAVQNEAERLFKLTKFPGSTIFLLGESVAFEQIQTEAAVQEDGDELLVSPGSWIQDADISKYRGQDIVVRVTYRETEEALSDFWLSVRDQYGREITTARAPIERETGNDQNVMDFPLALSNSATEMVYGLNSSPPMAVWIESVDFVSESRERASNRFGDL